MKHRQIGACASFHGDVHQVSDDAAVLFDPSSEESMRVAIEGLLGNDGLRAEMIRRGHERIHHFSWDKCAAETAGIEYAPFGVAGYFSRCLAGDADAMGLVAGRATAKPKN